MPFCTVCSIHFTGRGSYCTLHNPYIQIYHNDFDSSDTRYHTGALAKYHHRPRKPLQIGYRDRHDGLPAYRSHASSNALALAGYDVDAQYEYDGGEQRRGSDPILRAANLQPLTATFAALSSIHAITQLTYAIDVHGTRSVTATANAEREQCPGCGIFFPDRYRLLGHYADFPVKCDVHGVCLKWDDVLVHADEERHDRCFVRGCKSVYRHEGGWKGAVVEGHIRGMHRITSEGRGTLE